MCFMRKGIFKFSFQSHCGLSNIDSEKSIRTCIQEQIMHSFFAQILTKLLHADGKYEQKKSVYLLHVYGALTNHQHETLMQLRSYNIKHTQNNELVELVYKLGVISHISSNGCYSKLCFMT